MDPALHQLTDGLRFPEGPVVLPNGSLVVAELAAGCLTRVHADGRRETLSDNGGSPNGVALGPDGALYVCNSGGWDFTDLGGFLIPSTELPAHHSGGRIERVDVTTGAVRVLYTECDGRPLIGPNDLVFDADGGMWFTDHGRAEGRVQHRGAVYYARADGSEIREVLFPLESPNGIGLAPDGSRLYVAETHTGRLFAWNVTGPGRLDLPGGVGAGGELLCGLPGMQLFDSLAVDGEGNVVVATLVTGALSVVSPGGELLEQIPVGDPMVTNVCFGGDGLRTAYATLSGTGRLVAFDYPRGGLALAFG